jgi:tetratricopeptide (TPR) repeat protein
VRAGAIALLGLLLAATPARADEKPWVKGVSAERRAAAQKLLQAGNALLIERNYVAALDKYREAIGSWDHPAIRFNIVRCLIQLDRPVEAVDELDRALAYGAEPLEEAVYTEALSYQKLLASQIAAVSLSCTQPGVQVTLDGQPLTTCPTTIKSRVKPGRHQLLGEKSGFLPRTVSLVVVGGTEERGSRTHDPLGANARIVHRYSSWLPWTVLGAGLVVVGAGGLVQLVASNDQDTYERELERTCSTGCGGAELQNLRDLESRARLENHVALGIVGAGIATVITGGVLLFMNRGRTVYETTSIGVTPSSGGATVTLGGSF